MNGHEILFTPFTPFMYENVYALCMYQGSRPILNVLSISLLIPFHSRLIMFILQGLIKNSV